MLMIVLVLLTLVLNAQDSIPDIIYSDSITKIDANIALDSITLNDIFTNLRHEGEIKIKSDNKSIFEYIFPSLIALIVGLIAYLSTIKSSNKQIETIKKQMENSKASIELQILSNKEIAQLDFRKSVLSTNRQAWINDLRELISELISILLSYTTNEKDEADQRKLNFLLLKVELMLNPEKDNDFIVSLHKLQKSLVQLSIGRKEYVDIEKDVFEVKNHTKKTLKNEWERVKKGE